MLELQASKQASEAPAPLPSVTEHDDSPADAPAQDQDAKQEAEQEEKQVEKPEEKRGAKKGGKRGTRRSARRKAKQEPEIEETQDAKQEEKQEPETEETQDAKKEEKQEPELEETQGAKQEEKQEPEMEETLDGKRDTKQDAPVSSPAPPAPPAPPAQEPKTPSSSTPIKPPMSAMHPSKVRPTMAPPSSGLRLGFTDIRPTANRDDGLPPVAQTTPSKVTMSSSPFDFKPTRPGPISSLKLGPEAQRLRESMKDDVAKIKAGLMAEREAEKAEEEKAAGRKIAQAKGKMDRFNAAHMAEFKKMDSIENHPSLLRYQPGRMTPLKAGVKRSQSKANLDEPETAPAKKPAPASAAAKPESGAAAAEPVSAVKRARQHIDEDATSKRSASREVSSIPVPKSAGSGIPRSRSNLAGLMTPTKSSLARAATVGVKTPSRISLVRSPSKPTPSGIPRSATTGSLAQVDRAGDKEPTQAAEIKSPGSRLDKVKAVFGGDKADPPKTGSALPLPSASVSKTPAPVRLDKDKTIAPQTTPGRRLTKRVAFTPGTHRAAQTQNSPSPVKSNIPQAEKPKQGPGEVFYPSLDGILAEQNSEGGVSFPDISERRPLPEPPVKTSATATSAGPSAPGTFTFRSDHTVSFGNAPKSFGASPGQASIRAVRPSILPSETTMPGSFPTPEKPSSSPNKENEAPRSVFLALPHGMSTKKRHRANSDEEDAEKEAAQRAAKKRKQEEVAEGDALVAPRLARTSASASAKRQLGSPRKLPVSSHATGTPSPMKKTISLSRLNMLARPKLRK